MGLTALWAWLAVFASPPAPLLALCPSWFEVDGDELYWYSKDEPRGPDGDPAPIWRRARAGGKPQPIAHRCAGPLAIADTDLFCVRADGATIDRVAKDGRGITPLATLRPAIEQLVVDATDVYVLGRNEANRPTIFRIPRAGGDPEKVIVTDGFAVHFAITSAADGDELWWIDRYGLWRRPKHGDTALQQLVAQPLDTIESDVVVRSSTVFVKTGLRCDNEPFPCGEVLTVDRRTSRAGARTKLRDVRQFLVGDDGAIYWYGQNGLYAAGSEKQPPRRIADAPRVPVRLDRELAYWFTLTESLDPARQLCILKTAPR